MLEIPVSLVINWDQTGIQYVPVSSWTMEIAGLKQVEIAGADDNRQITLLATTAHLPGQDSQMPTKHRFPAGWDIMFIENHWSNETVMICCAL